MQHRRAFGGRGRRLLTSVRRAAVAVALVVVASPVTATPDDAAKGMRRDTADVQAVATTTPIVIDGRLDEPVWATAPVVGEFVQREPTEGAAPSEPTEVRLAYDTAALYVGIRAVDREPARMAGMLTRRDERSPSDWVRVAIDSFHDRRTAYEFGVNPVGVKTDRYYFNDGDSDDSWDAVWDVQVSRDAGGWNAEFRIPFSQLRFSAGRDALGIAILRDFPRANEVDTWPLIARSVNGFVSQFGTVRGVPTATSAKRLELMPYTVGEVVRATVDRANPLVRPTDPGANVGVDLKYAVTPALTLTATLNPDFGQVEADPAAVNLDAFELFFSERRPFFVEGSGIFRFNMDCNDGDCTGLLYSRRIGRAPQASASTAEGEYAAAPLSATILGAAKLTGRVGHFSVGALTAVTQEERARIAGPGGARTQAVEPQTSYNVLRARREFANNSNLGVMLTTTVRGSTPTTTFLADHSMAGGVDYDWRVSRRYSIGGFLVASRVGGSTEAITRLQRNAVHNFQRPDGDYLTLDPTATSLGGHAGGLSIAKIGGERVRFAANYGYKTPGFDSNDLGFQRRADERTMNHWLQWRDQVPGKYVREFMVNLNQWAGWNFGGDMLYSGANVNMHWAFQNNWRSGVGLIGNRGGTRDRSTRGGPVVRTNDVVSLFHYLEADDRRTFAPGYGGFVERDGQGTMRFNFNPRVTWRPSRAVRVETGVRFARNDDDAQWVQNVTAPTGDVRYVFGRLEQRTVAMTLRANYTLSPTLSFQSYAEPFVSAGRYEKFRALIDGRAAAYPDRFVPFAYTGDPDFNFRSFRTTNVLRWEFRPGSALFAVWQQGRQENGGDGEFRFGRDVGGLFSTPARNVFLVKFSYWFNY